MRETLPHGGHALYHHFVARRLASFYDRLAQQVPPARRILDVGCGPGQLARSLTHHQEATVIGVDLDPVQVRTARRHTEVGAGPLFVTGDVRCLPFPDGAFDLVVTTESYHHWGDPDRGLAETHRVLAPGGHLWIVEGAGDQTRKELSAWSGRRVPPGLHTLARWIFRRHGYLPEALEHDVLGPLKASPFASHHVRRVDGWWIVDATA